MPLPPLVEPVAALSDAERARTARHAALAGFGPKGQKRLRAARIGVVGAGGLGSSALLALAAAGVGTIVLIEDDTVDVSNLHRQIIHGVPDIGRSKLESATAKILAVSPETIVEPHEIRLDESNALELLRGCDIVLDGTDTMATRTAVATTTERLGIPLVWATVQEWHAQLTVFWSAPPEGVEPIVLADLYDPATVGEPPACSAVGVLGALTIQVGALMAAEAIKLVTGAGTPLLGRVVLIDGLNGRQREVEIRPARRSPDAGDAGDEAHALA